ncbi:ABC transporter permease [Photobacterium alginatilyticum]|uniref:ABC transporter permease n=1 Tax=Photobacterium alginatilyticum TaxID=1775171 RepID=UPI004068AA08
MWTDFKYALRLLMKAPAFSLFTLLVMTAGLALSIYMYSFINTLALKALPFPDSDQVVVIDQLQNGMRHIGGRIPEADALEIKQRNNAFEDFVLYAYYLANVDVDAKARRNHVIAIEADSFLFTGVKPVLGRVFNTQDMVQGAEPVAVISYTMWQERFARRADAIGEVLYVDGHRKKVVGVMPEGYEFPGTADLWLPVSVKYIKRDSGFTLAGVARLKDGVSIEAANQDVQRIMASLAIKYPETNHGTSAYVDTFQVQAITPQMMPTVWALLGVSVLVLLLASINVGSMLLSKSAERAKEIATRMALGAPRFRLIGQMLWESIIICVISAVFALFIAAWALDLTTSIMANASFTKPIYWWDFKLDSDTVIATVVVVIVTIFISGFLPAWKATSRDFNQILRDGSRGATNHYTGRFSRILVSIEVILSVFILIVASMLISYSKNAAETSARFDQDKMLSFNIYMPWEGYVDPGKRYRFLSSVEREIMALPQVRNIALGSSAPGIFSWASTIKAMDTRYELEKVLANTVSTNNNFFESFGIRPLYGRLFDHRDTQESQRVTVISDSLAKQLWPNESPLGKQIHLVDISDDHVATVIGVISHIDYGSPYLPSSQLGSIYVSNSQFSTLFNYAVIDYDGSSRELLNSIDTIMRELDANVSLAMVMQYGRLLDKQIVGMVFGARLFVILGAVALLLAATGIYGVMANSISQRVREIGIRRALGASEGQVILFFIRKSFIQLLIGVTLGLGLALFICYQVLYLFVGSTMTMSLIFILIPCLIAVVIMTATLIPVKRALRLEPAIALREE